MCGIISYIGIYDSFKFLIKGLELLQNRGYDSAGILTINTDNMVKLSKFSNESGNAITKLKSAEHLHSNANFGIGHTRWATHGEKSERNAHPHHNNEKSIFLVHNGTIENCSELKNYLLNLNYEFNSDTDTELIVNYISSEYDKNIEMKEILKNLDKKLKGTWALALININEPDRIYLVKNGMPLLLGFNDEMLLASSETVGFFNYVEKYYELNDNDVFILSKKDSKLSIIKDNENYSINQTTKSLIESDPYPFSHWTIKEIYEQPMSCLRAFNMGKRFKNDSEVNLNGLNQYQEKIAECENLIIIGSGTSYHAGELGMKYIKEFELLKNVMCIEASEFTKKDIINLDPDKTMMIVLSQSGETKDVHRIIEMYKDSKILIIGIVNVLNSLIARQTNCGIYLNAGRENGVASTKSFTSQVIVMILFSIYLSQIKGTFIDLRTELIKYLNYLPLNIENTLKSIYKCKELLTYLKYEQSCFILGKDYCHPIAKEGALKMKEISYIHAEGYPSGALKHGPFALIKKNTPIIILSPDYENDFKLSILAEEVKARGARTILITNKNIIDNKLYDHVIEIPYNKYYGNILANIILQIISYELSVSKGINPDMPRNLAKVVTVD